MARGFSPFFLISVLFCFLFFLKCCKSYLGPHIFSVKVELLQEILWQMPILFDKLFIALVHKRRLVKVVITLFINYSRLLNATQGASSLLIKENANWQYSNIVGHVTFRPKTRVVHIIFHSCAEFDISHELCCKVLMMTS